MIKLLDVSHETIKILEENSKISDISHGNIFSAISPQERGKKRKKKKMGLHQTEKFFAQQRKPLTKREGNLLSWRRYLQMIPLIKG